MTSTQPHRRRANRLARETSPYLLQHAHHPVDWHPWGDEAFALARAEDKPILLSVGYASCHWCHVMARESFDDPAIARLLAEGFVAVKLDREERPDVDALYMGALQALSGRGGWPMNMFLTPRLAPFFGGSYFPPRPLRGLPAFADVLAAVRQAWLERRDEVEAQAERLLGQVRDGSAPAPRAQQPGDGADDDPHGPALARIARAFDPAHGGFGRAPKFPHAPLLHYLLALAAEGDAAARRMLVATLHAMAAGGVYDQIGGGFARYSTDERWHVPHFEKMLVDNAQLARVYAGAWRLAGDERFKAVAEGTLDYLLREMHPTAAAAAFASAQDADAAGVEGSFHVWTLAEFEAVLDGDAQPAARLYGVTRRGNWEDGKNVPERRDPERVRAAFGVAPAAFDAWERSVRERLYAARARRSWPASDDKVLADGNAMALRAFAEAGRLFGRDDYLEAARRLARFLLGAMVRGGDRVHHVWRDGRLRDEGFLADAAQLGLGLVELHAASGELEWLTAAQRLCAGMVERFHDPAHGFVDSDAAELPLRAHDARDGAAPSGTAAACELLLRLAGAFGRDDWADIALRTFERHGDLLDDAAMAVPALLHARLLADRGAALAVPAGPGSDALWDEARTAFAPLVTRVRGAPGALPLLEGRFAGAAYLCRHGRCELPARSREALRRQLTPPAAAAAPGDDGAATFVADAARLRGT